MDKSFLVLTLLGHKPTNNGWRDKWDDQFRGRQDSGVGHPYWNRVPCRRPARRGPPTIDKSHYQIGQYGRGMDRVGGAFVFDSSNRSLIVLFLLLFNPLPFISLWLTRQSYPTPARAPFTPPIVGHSVIISQSQLSIVELSFGQIKLIGVVKEEVNPLITTSIETDSCFQLAKDLLPKRIAQAAAPQLPLSRVSLLIAGLSPKNQSVECVWSCTIHGRGGMLERKSPEIVTVTKDHPIVSAQSTKQTQEGMILRWGNKIRNLCHPSRMI